MQTPPATGDEMNCLASDGACDQLGCSRAWEDADVALMGEGNVFSAGHR